MLWACLQCEIHDIVKQGCMIQSKDNAAFRRCQICRHLIWVIATQYNNMSSALRLSTCSCVLLKVKQPLSDLKSSCLSRQRAVDGLFHGRSPTSSEISLSFSITSKPCAHQQPRRSASISFEASILQLRLLKAFWSQTRSRRDDHLSPGCFPRPLWPVLNTQLMLHCHDS